MTMHDPASPDRVFPVRPAHMPPSTSARHIDSIQLLAGARELVIEHLGQRYYLRLTCNNKLILTK